MNTRQRCILAFATLLVACWPTEPCACPPDRSSTIVFGQVREASGDPAAERRVAITAATPWQSPACDFSNPEPLSFAPDLTDEAGRFRAAVYSPYGPESRCLRIAAYTGTPGASDSTIALLTVTFRRHDERSDSTGVILTLPD